MQKYWGSVLEPIIKALKPSSIIEVGSDKGLNTRRLLDYARREGASVHVIDPLPQYDVEGWKKQYGNAVTFHRDLSLNVLPGLPYSELVLIDGDHNWYTVINELKLVKRSSREHKKPFPLVVLHDVGWPYGRRDLYYNPKEIPEEYRHAHARKGMKRGVPQLLDDGGINRDLANAEREGGPRNGVLTAVEDFMDGEADMDLTLWFTPPSGGLGILATEDFLAGNEALRSFLDSLCEDQNDPSPEFVALRTSEYDRLETLIRLRQLEGRVRQLEAKNRALTKQAKAAERKAERLVSWGRDLENAFSALRSSWQWKAGQAFGEGYRRITRKPKVLPVEDRINKLFDKLRRW